MGCDTQFLYPESFLKFLVDFSYFIDKAGDPLPGAPTPEGADWWVSLAIALGDDESLYTRFERVHQSVRTVLNIFQPWTETKSFILVLLVSLHSGMQNLEPFDWASFGIS